jgi:ABC-type histidine transport system ATPase subunit
MGDTSSGKSSLLTSISMVELPSASELTTQCPIRLRMKVSDKRSARVFVQWKKPPSNKSRKRLAFPVKIIAEEEWAKLPDAIAEAQRHIIDITGKEVASDVVEVEIVGPQCEDLNVVDLPGIVHTTGKGESATMGEDIKELIGTYQN